VNNFPATQPISGTVGVSNFPATQPISGTVGVNNFPAIQPVRQTQIDFAGTPKTVSLKSKIDLKPSQLNLFYNRINSGTATHTYNSSENRWDMSVSANNDYAIAQTIQRFNYQTGDVQSVEFTFVNLVPKPGVVKRAGYFSSSSIAPFTASKDGIFFETDDTSVYAVGYRNGTESFRSVLSSTVDGIVIDWSKAEIAIMEFLWLGYGGAKFMLSIDGQPRTLHIYYGANNDTSIFMLSPNQPIRFEIRSTGGSDIFSYTCATVGSYGEAEELGYNSSLTGPSVAVGAANTNYVLMAIRLKADMLYAAISVLEHGLLSAANDNYMYQLRICEESDISGTLSWSDVSESALQLALGTGTQTIASSAGKVLHTKMGIQNSSNEAEVKNALRLGARIDGTRKLIAFTFTPYTATSSAIPYMNILELL
jgi:hypothetical protein